MDFQSFIDCVEPVSCVLSVEKLSDGTCGKIRIVCGNHAYIDSLKSDHLIGKNLLSHELEPNSDYEKYFPKNQAFEENCFRAAIEKEPVHTYVHSDMFGVWFDIYVMPLCSDLENVGYFLNFMSFSESSDNGNMTSLSH